MMPRISVLMGIYNCSKTLIEALDSLCIQTCQDFKIILCDDGSTDETYAIAQSYSQTHENVVLLRNDQNIKLAATLNHCLEYADTEYIARMDGDDVSLPKRFEKELLFLDSHPEMSFVSCPMIYFDDSGEWGRGTCVERPTKTDFRTGAAPFCHAPVMMRTACIKAVGGYRTDHCVERMEDYDLFARLYIAGYVGANLREHLYMMRNDQNAFRRRKMVDRWRSYRTASELKKDLGLSWPYLSGIPDLMKALVPNKMAYYLKRHINV